MNPIKHLLALIVAVLRAALLLPGLLLLAVPGGEGDGGGEGKGGKEGDGDEEEDDDAKDEKKGKGDEDPGDDPEKLKAALDRERAARREAARDLRRERARHRGNDKQDKGKGGDKSDDEKIAAAREEGRREALKTANAQLVRAEIALAAAGRMAKPSLAPRLLSDQIGDIEVTEDGRVDTKAINDLLEELLEENPELAAGKATRTATGGNHGNDGGKPKPKDMNDRIRDTWRSKRGA